VANKKPGNKRVGSFTAHRAKFIKREGQAKSHETPNHFDKKGREKKKR